VFTIQEDHLKLLKYCLDTTQHGEKDRRKEYVCERGRRERERGGTEGAIWVSESD
jgi:hypothetical protein